MVDVFSDMSIGVMRNEGYERYERYEHRGMHFSIEYNDTYDYNDSEFFFFLVTIYGQIFPSAIFDLRGY
jgi:hypothetical protein